MSYAHSQTLGSRFTRATQIVTCAMILAACGWMPFKGDSASSESQIRSGGSASPEVPVTASTPPPRPPRSMPAPATPPASAAPAPTQMAQQQGSPVRLNPRHPDRYTVQRGDTLWDIASMFLQDPWYWPEIWQINPQVENPHLIFPGDILSLAYLNGRPVINLQRGTATRLSPRVRVEPLEEAIPTLPFDTIRAFLSRPAVLERNQIDNLPYILSSSDGRLISGAGSSVYVRGTDSDPGEIYNIVHVGDPLVDPDNNDVLGYEGIFVGQGRLSRAGDPSTLLLMETAREALNGDRLMPEESLVPQNYYPRAPEGDIDGSIISVIDGVSLIGQYQIVVINRGTRHGLEPGHVLRVWQSGEVVRDRFAKGRLLGQKVQLPDEPAGTMMVFRIFDRMSYGLVMEATSEIKVLDAVRNPT